MARYYLGLDVHQVRTQYCLVDGGGAVVREGSVPTEDVLTLVDRPDLAAVLEASGDWCAPYDTLRASGVAVKLAHPARVKAIAAARIKTDKIDARILAHLLRTDLIPEAWAAPQETRELRALVRLRWGFVSVRTQAKNRLHSLLRREGLRCPHTDLLGRAGQAGLHTADVRPHTRARWWSSSSSAKSQPPRMSRPSPAPCRGGWPRRRRSRCSRRSPGWAS